MDSFIYYVYLVCFLLTGLAIGSFINVVIYRLPMSVLPQYTPDGELGVITLSWPPSHCPQCNTMILKRDNIPVLGWVLLKGRCRFCHKPIPAIYPITEFIFGLWFVAVYLFVYPDSGILYTLSLILFFSLLYAISMIDIQHYIIPDRLNYLLLWSGLLLSVTEVNRISPWSAVIGVCAIWCITYSVMYLYEAMKGQVGLGYGDVKLFAAIMPWIGVENIHYLILFSSMIGGAIFSFHALFKPRLTLYANGSHDEDELQKYIPLGPAICLSALIIFLLQGYRHSII